MISHAASLPEAAFLCQQRPFARDVMWAGQSSGVHAPSTELAMPFPTASATDARTSPLPSAG